MPSEFVNMITNIDRFVHGVMPDDTLTSDNSLCVGDWPLGYYPFNTSLKPAQMKGRHETHSRS